MADLRSYPDRDLLMRAAAEEIVSRYESAINTAGHFSIVLAGGSTPRALYTLLAEDSFSQYIDWSLVYVFWGDERCVSPDDEASNYHMARQALLDRVPIPLTNIYRMRGEDDPQEAATAYEETVRGFFAARGADTARFDLVLLGMGDDGHTASLFPDTAALNETERLVVANHVPKLDSWRLTLTFPAINAAAGVIFLVSGAGKADALRAIWEGPPGQFPAQMIDPAGDLLWLVDDAAADGLGETD